MPEKQQSSSKRPGLSRRGLARLAGFGAVAGVAGALPAVPAAAATAPDAPDGAGYRVTEHVDTYYRLARF